MKITGYLRAEYLDRPKYPELTPYNYRATGRTTRQLLKCLIEVSEKPDIPVMIIAFNLDYAKDLAGELIGLSRCIGIRLPESLYVYSLDEWLEYNGQFNTHNAIILRDHYERKS